MWKKYHVSLFFLCILCITFYSFSNALSSLLIEKKNKVNDFATVGGRITFTDATGANALVTLINESTGSIYEDTTDSEGYYTIENVQTPVHTIPDRVQEEFTVYSNYPNPVGDDTVIPFRTLQSGEVTIIIYNILGVEVDKKTYFMESGLHGVRYVPKGAGGVQFYKVISGEKELIGKFATLDAFIDGGLKEEVSANLSGGRDKTVSQSIPGQVEKSMEQLYTVCVQSPDSLFEEIIDYHVPIARDTTMNFTVTRIGTQILVVDTDTLHFDSDQNQLGFTIENGGTDTLSWSITGDADWLMFYALNGKTVTEVEQVAVAVARSGLTAGMYDGTLTITSNGGTATIGVSMDVSPISLSTTTIHFTTADTTHTFFITNSDTGSFDWHISVTEDWILVDPMSGTTTTEIDTINVTIDENYGISDSTTGSIIVSPGLSKAIHSSASGDSRIDVTNPYYTKPCLIVHWSGIHEEFNCRHDGPIQIKIENHTYEGQQGISALHWQLVSSHPFLTVTPNSGVTYSDDVPVEVNLTQNSSGFERGKLYSCTLAVLSDHYCAAHLIYFHDPIGAVTPETLDFGTDLNSLSFEVYNKGTKPEYDFWITWELHAPDVSWISSISTVGDQTLSVDNPTDEVDVNIDRSGLPPGTYEATITIEHWCCGGRVEYSDVELTMEISDYSIEYYHGFMTEEGYPITTTIMGEIPVYLNDSDNTLEGSGTLDIAMAGYVEMGTYTIDIVGGGTATVTIDGRKIPKGQGDADLEINFTEIWYQDCQQVWTYHLPEGDEEQTVIIPEGSNNHTLTFPMVDGHMITAPFVGEGVDGELSWTLHIHQ